eukprot:g2217.t1
MHALKAKQNDFEASTSTLIFWLPVTFQAPRRRDTENFIPNGQVVEAQYRGSWHNARVISSTNDKIQISWEYDRSLAEAAEGSGMERGNSRSAWLRNPRIMAVVGHEQPRLECEAQVEALDGHEEEDMTYQFEVCALASLKLDGLWLGGPASMAFAAAEKAIPCAMQLLGSKIMLAGSDVHRERAKEYLSFVQQSRKDIEEVPGLRGGGRLSVTDADMREDVLPVLLPEEAARCLSLERIAEIQRATRTFLVFDTGRIPGLS